jgi:hypothetical protein
MLMLSLFRLAAIVIPRAVHLTTCMLARSLNLPQPVVHDTGVFVLVQVQAIESRIGKALCPVRLMQRLRSLLHR